MSTYDEENFIYDLKSLIIEKLPAKIAEINAEKNDDITLELVDANDFIDNLGEEIINADPLVYFGLAGIEPLSVEASTARTVGVFFDVIFINDHSQGLLTRKALRYSRVLREIIEKNFRVLPQISKLSVESMTPTDVKLNDDETYYKVAGIVISGTLWS